MCSPRLPTTARARGFTAIELLVTIAIVAILAGIGAPSFTPMIERWRVRQAAEELQATIYYARSEAIKRGGNVTISNPSSGTWRVRHGTTDLQVYTAPPNVTMSLDKGSGSITLDRWGMLLYGTTSTALDFTIKPDSGNLSSASHVCVSIGGRVTQKTSC